MHIYITFIPLILLNSCYTDCFVVRNVTFPVSDQLLCRLMSMKMPLWSFLFSSSYNLIALNIERYISLIAPIYHKTQVRIIRSCHNRDMKIVQTRSRSMLGFSRSANLPDLSGFFSLSRYFISRSARFGRIAIVKNSDTLVI